MTDKTKLILFGDKNFQEEPIKITSEMSQSKTTVRIDADKVNDVLPLRGVTVDYFLFRSKVTSIQEMDEVIEMLQIVKGCLLPNSKR